MLEVNHQAFVQLRETTERALEAARLKSEFLANMSHEIRTPMNGVIGMANLMLAMPLDGRLRRYVETIDVSGKALLTIINDILDFSKMEAGKYQIQHTRYEPRMVVQDVAELLAPKAHEKGLELVYRVDPQVPGMVVGDPDRFKQILNNLVGNAVKFTDQGEIFIEVTVPERGESDMLMRVDVVDTGVGIAEKDVAAAFDAFSQVDGSMIRKQGGTGLGLAIARRLATMMGGTVDVSSVLGVGSRFWLTMRVDIEPAEQEDVEITPLRFPTGRRALVIECNRRWCAVIGEHMSNWGLECHTEATAQKALGRLTGQTTKYDVVVIGNASDHQSFSDIISSLRKRDELNGVPLILLHQLGTTAPLGELEREIAAQLPKPLRMSDLYNSLQEAFVGRTRRRNTPEVSQQPAHHGGIKILVVDDNEINRFVAAEQLTEAGFEWDLASNGLEAVQKVEEGNFAIVLMDCQMPVMDGYTASREIRKKEEGTTKHQVIIALTAHAMIGERDRVLAAGMDDYISKPLRSNVLTKMIARYTKSESATRLLAASEAGESQHPPQPHQNDTATKTRPAPEGATPHVKNGAGGASKPAATATATDPNANSELADVPRSRTLVTLCLREMPKQMDAVIQALAKKDAPGLRAAVHKLKGSSMAITADAMSDIAAKVQHLAEAGDLETAAPLVEQLAGRMVKVEAALKNELVVNGTATEQQAKD
jgi:CheY-like chemotaxis protein/HPt (histidine-containing phosphotransfer) domain-containing protein